MKKSIEILDNICSDIHGQVDRSLGSLFTKDDVKSIISKIALEFEMIASANNPEEQQKMNFDFASLKEKLKLRVEDAVNTLRTHHVVEIDNDSAEFSIGYGNKLELDSVEFEINHDKIFEEVEDVIEDVFEEIEIPAEIESTDSEEQ